MLDQNEKSTGIRQTPEDLFHWAWSQRGYSDTEIEKIWKLREEFKDDEIVWQKMEELGIAREPATS